MTTLAAALLMIAVLLGTWLAASALRPDAGRPARALRLAHAAPAALGVLAAGAILARTGRPVGTLTWEALALVIAALALGGLLWRRRLPQSRGMVLLIHALSGATGAAILAGWLLG